MLKKIVALFVLAVFMVSMAPGVFAQDYQVVQAADIQAQNMATAQIAVQTPLIAQNAASVNVGTLAYAWVNSSESDDDDEEYEGSDDDSQDSEDDSQSTTETSDTSTNNVGTAGNVYSYRVSATTGQVRSRIRSEFEDTRDEDTDETDQEEKSIVRAEISERLSDAPTFVRRIVTVETLAAARQRYETAKENYENVKDAYEAQREDFVEIRKQYRECSTSSSDSCLKVKEDVKTEAREHLLNSADLILKELERVKEKVQSSEDLSESEIAGIVAEIDVKVSEVQSARKVIENLDGNSTREEINDAAKTIRKSWIEVKTALKKHIARLMNARLGNIIHSTEMLEKRIYTARDKLAEKGADVSALDLKLEEFSSKLDTAAEKYSEAVEKFRDAKSADEVDEAAKEVHALLTEAKQALKDARDLLREIVSEIKRLNSGSLDVVPAETAETTA